MSGTHVYYNGVLMRDCDIRQWKQDIVKDDSGTDVLYSKVSLTVESELISLINQSNITQSIHGITAHQSTIAVPYLPQETVVDRHQEIEWRLQEHRKDFWLALNGVTYNSVVPANSPPQADGSNNASYRVVLAATGLSLADLEKMEGVEWSALKDVDLGLLDGFHDFGTGKPSVNIERRKVVDLNNGPKPYDVSIVKTVGGQSLRVSVTIEVCRCFCKPISEGQTPPDSEPSPVIGSDRVYGVISNKWSVVETMDQNWNSQHSLSGKMVVSDARYKPHAMRLIAIPKMAPYFRLDAREFATDPTGLVLAYNFVMKETGPSPLPGVVSWKGHYVETAGPGGHKTAEISVRVVGQTNPVNAMPGAADPGRDHKVALIQAAYRIAQSRIRWSTRFAAIPGSDPKAVTVLNTMLVEEMESSSIELRIRVLYTDKNEAGKPVGDNFGLRLENFGASLKTVVPAYDPRWWPIPEAFPWDASFESQKQFNDTGSFYDNYFQTPCSLWHSTLESPKDPGSQLREYEPVVMDASLSSTDPLDQPPGVAINGDLLGWSDSQVDFSYLQCDIDTKHRMNSGNIHLPLSKARYPSSDTSIVVNLFPGIANRVLTMVATRIGDWPKVPSPKSVVTHGSIRETYIDGETVADTPKLTRDGKTLLYSLQVQWTYALNRLPLVASDKLLAASDPRIKTTPDGNAIKMSDYFTDGVVEIA